MNINLLKITLGGLAGIIAISLYSPPVNAQGASCYDLWHERNSIFASKGYCFKTQQARSVFGPGCFSPYGRLSRSEQSQVDYIRRQERNMGCRKGGQVQAPAAPSGSYYAGMGCSQLWHERNSIFARNGHCFKTARGRAAFGRNCFAPYGKLGPADQREVNKILEWEGRKRCR